MSDLSKQISKLMTEAKEGDEDTAVLRLSAERRRLDERLIAMTRENQKLRSELAGRGDLAGADAAASEPDALLREQISALAAQVIAMTAAMEGPNSPVDKALETPEESGSVVKLPTDVVSLADRVKALRKANSSS